MIVVNPLEVRVSLTQLVGTMYNIYKVQSSNLGHHKKKKKNYLGCHGGIDLRPLRVFLI